MANRSMNSPEDSQAVLKLDARIARALEIAPPPEIPDDFAARLAATVPAMVSATLVPRRHGRNAGIICVAVLLALIFLFARGPLPASPLWLSIESIFCIQFALIAVWLAVRDLGPYFEWLS